MEVALTKVVVLYLLFPLIGLLLGGVMFFIAKKNQLLSDKKAIFYFLAACILLALPALLGFIDYWFMPYCFTGLLVLYLLLGSLHLSIQDHFIKGIDARPYYVEFLSVFVIMIIGMALFSLIFNLCNELEYGLIACTCMITFIFPSVFRKAYQTFLNIPLEIYDIWSYRNEDDMTGYKHMDNNRIIVVELEIFKQEKDRKPSNIKAKADDNIPFGIWFKHFISDYNKKSPKSMVTASDESDSFGWMFYASSSILGRKKHIDTNLSFLENNIKEKNVILAQRIPYNAFDQE